MKNSAVALSAGDRVRVVRGRQFQNFGAGDAGVAVRVDRDAGTCDVAFDGREGCLTVAIRYLEADSFGAAKLQAPGPGRSLHTGDSRHRASSNTSSVTDPDRHEVMWDGILATDGSEQREQQQQQQQQQEQLQEQEPEQHDLWNAVADEIIGQPARCASEVQPSIVSDGAVGERELHERRRQQASDLLGHVRRLREIHTPSGPQDAAGFCGVDATAALNEALQASASATAAAAANAVGEVGALRLAFNELRELILQEAEQRVAGLWVVQDGLRHVTGQQSPHDGFVQRERRYDQRQAELVSLCASLQNLKDQHATGLGLAGSATGTTNPKDWELSVQLPLTVRLNSLDDRFSLVEERLAQLSGRIEALASTPQTPPVDTRDFSVGSELSSLAARVDALQELVHTQTIGAETLLPWELRLEKLDARVDALIENEAQRNGDISIQKHDSDAAGHAQQALLTEFNHHSAELRIAAAEAIAKVEQQAGEAVRVGEEMGSVLEAHAEADRERAKLLDAMQSRLETVSECVAAEARIRQDTISQLEATLRKSWGDAMSSSTPTKDPEGVARSAFGNCPKPATLEKNATVALARLAGQATRTHGAEKTVRRLRGELGVAGVMSPRLEQQLVPGHPRTPRIGTPAATGPGIFVGSPDREHLELQQSPVTAGGDDVTVRRVLRVESSPARQITLQQASAVVRGASCGVHAMDNGLQEPVAGQMTPQPVGHSGSITPMTPGVPLPMMGLSLGRPGGVVVQPPQPPLMGLLGLPPTAGTGSLWPPGAVPGGSTSFGAMMP
eukprot:CAMPEP_0172814206 /NCGR_PEP_ID=MMETSP1075-20121228/11112_1 /TAXON_ID=2916 /ORGANISM="Ceratium fusus, Strain PA161109" /LENGTH=788 /DNA_ID=CAMNT_0013653993 /DNA_START=31 /DNA_END=2397 /DNA_ORIENTATION=+